MNYINTKNNYINEKDGIVLPVFMILLYIFVEYARPSFLAFIRPALIIQIILVFYLLENKSKVALLLKEKFFKYYIILIGFMVLNIFMAENYYWAYFHLQLVLSYMLIGISFCIFLNNVNRLKAFFLFFISVMALCAIDRIVGVGLIGASGHMGDENDFALAMNVVFPFSFFLWRVEKGYRKWIFGTASILFVLANMVSQSRGGFLGLVGVGTVCWFCSRHKVRTLLIITVLGILAWSFASPEFKKEIAGIGFDSAESDTGQDRVELWKVGWRAFLDNPILGVGQGNMPIVMEKYQYDEKGEDFWGRGLWGRSIHSIYFTLIPELGLVGIVLIGLMFKDLLIKFKKTNEVCRKLTTEEKFSYVASLNVAMMVSLLGFLFTGIFLSAFYYPEFWNISSLIVALFLVTTKSKNNDRTFVKNFKQNAEALNF